MAYINPSVNEFKKQLARDFPYGGTNGDLTTIQDLDIKNAQVEAGININQSLFANQAAYSLGFNLLTAHYLVMDLRASAAGIQGTYPWMTSSKGVGSVNESIQIPEQIMRNPYMAMLSKTYYGAKYLNLVLPSLVGAVFTAHGRTNY